MAKTRPLPVPAQMRTVEPMDYAAYRTAFHAAARADGKGRLADVPLARIAQAQAEGLSPQEAVFRVRMERLLAGSAGFDRTARGLDHLEGARKSRAV